MSFYIDNLAFPIQPTFGTSTLADKDSMPTDCCVGSLTCQNGLSDDVRLSWLDSGDFPYFGIIILNLRIWLLSSYKKNKCKVKSFPYECSRECNCIGSRPICILKHSLE